MGEFISNNIALVALFFASGLMLVWPEISLWSLVLLWGAFSFVFGNCLAR